MTALVSASARPAAALAVRADVRQLELLPVLLLVVILINLLVGG